MLTRVTAAKAREVLASLTEYSESLLPERRHFLSFYRPIDVAFKVVGTGSVGLRDYVIYFQGNGPGDPLFLQIKEEARSAYEPYLGSSAPITRASASPKASAPCSCNPIHSSAGRPSAIATTSSAS